MKKLSLLLLTLTVCFFTACHKDIWAELENLDQRVTKLEELCKEMNTNITSLQTIVSVLQSNDFITGIVEIKKNGEVIGYTITFGKHDPITIYHGQDGKDGADGKDGQDGSANAPVIGVAQDTDGVYYWTLNGEWLLDDNGNKLPVSGKDGQNGTNGSNGQDGADGKDGQDGEDGKDGADGKDGKDGITPQLKIEEGYWFISYDNGATWTQLGKATGEDGKDGIDGKNGKDGQNGADGKDGQDGDSMFQSVTQDENYVYFTLADGTVIKIAKASKEEQPNSEFMFVVTYDANGGEGTMQPDTFYYGVSKQLSKVKYTKSAHIFTYWNTKADGSGISYEDGQTLMISKNITLYAQWNFPPAGMGVFSVGEGKKVTFSPGNLQYTQSSNTWSFAENQWDMIGTDNVTGGSVFSDPNYGYSKSGTALADKVDLFGWSTSATNFGVSTSEDYDDYSGPFVDWGTNKIGNDASNTWRTLTYNEWYYVVFNRPNASSLNGVAQVNGVNGLILLPDNWTCPSGVTFKSGFHSSYDVDYYAVYQTFTAEQWSKLESAGAVFLPAAGVRYGSNVYSVQYYGSYWSATEGSSSNAYCLDFDSGGAYLDSHGRDHGLSVRLVKDL